MKGVIKIFSILIITFLLLLPSPISKCAENSWEYYISEQNSDGKIMKWQLTITGIRFRNSEGEFVTFYDNTEGMTQDVTGGGSASPGAQTVTFTTDLTIPEGTYTENWIRFGTNSTLKGYIKISDTEYYATMSNQENTFTASSAAEAEANAEDLVLSDMYSTEWERVNVEEEGNVAIDASKDYYTLFIKFNIIGTETNEQDQERGVGLVWNKTNQQFADGMMNETFTVIDSDGNEQIF